MTKLDTNNDGFISHEELAQAIRNNGGWFARWKANRALKVADENRNGFIDENEILKLVAFAEKELNVMIVGIGPGKGWYGRLRKKPSLRGTITGSDMYLTW
ncbi:hypothetical protein QVD17_39150 [Tagetes erecta]|uniref:EF-hand domain-containing protein n=1 Tax=Tagetes erecta TaxID=13708 RepID=A0AAD8JQ53_TARER|nr:hypothetical protein QVD17_39150 [Tagetes erecta]